MRGRAPCLLISLIASLMALSACNGPTVRLPVRDERPPDAGDDGSSSGDDDDDDDDDEEARCDAENTCRDDRKNICGPLGICVECVVDDDCDDDQSCDDRGECDADDD